MTRPMDDRRRRPDRRSRPDRRTRLALIDGGVGRRVWGAEAVEAIRRAIFIAKGLKCPEVYRVSQGRSRPMQTILTLADDLVPRPGGLLAASYLEHGLASGVRYVRAVAKETRPEAESRALGSVLDDGGHVA